MFAEVLRSTTLKGVNGFLNFQSIANRVAQGLVHIREQSNGFAIDLFGDLYHDAC